MKNKTLITIPAHPDDHEVPASLLHIKRENQELKKQLADLQDAYDGMSGSWRELSNKLEANEKLVARCMEELVGKSNHDSP